MYIAEVYSPHHTPILSLSSKAGTPFYCNWKKTVSYRVCFVSCDPPEKVCVRERDASKGRKEGRKEGHYLLATRARRARSRVRETTAVAGIDCAGHCCWLVVGWV